MTAEDEGGECVTAGDAPRLVLTRLNDSGRWQEASRRADRYLDGLTDPVEVTGVLIAKLASLVSMGRIDECPAVIDELWKRLQEAPRRPAVDAHFHCLASRVALAQGSLQRCIGHLVVGERIARTVDETDDTMRSWLSIAGTYSMIGMHKQAGVAQLEAQRISAGSSDADRRLTARADLCVRKAVYLDQQNRTEEAAALLDAMLEHTDPRHLLPGQRLYLGYGAARFALLGGTHSLGTAALLGEPVDPAPEVGEVIRLGRAVLAIAEGRSADALALLEHATTASSHLGPAEVERLRFLAHEGVGHAEAALQAQREITASFARDTEQLHELVMDGIAAQIDHQALRRRMRRYADEAYTDALTGLPNRRSLERHINGLVEQGGNGALAVGDVDRFKQVNNLHGHLAGDMVLAKVAALLTRTVRESDFLARYGGDEFVVVLPETDTAEAECVVERLTAAIADHDWSDLVPGISVTLTMAVAGLDGRADFIEAFGNADRSMLEAKRSRRPDERSD